MNNDCHARGRPTQSVHPSVKFVAVFVVVALVFGVTAWNGDWIISLLALLGGGYALQEGA